MDERGSFPRPTQKFLLHCSCSVSTRQKSGLLEIPRLRLNGAGSHQVSGERAPWELDHTGVEPEAIQLTPGVGADSGNGSLGTQLGMGLGEVASKGWLWVSRQRTKPD